MCTRVFNSPKTELEPNHKGFKAEFDKLVESSILVTGRNMDWKCPLDMDFYITLNDQDRVGLTDLEYEAALGNLKDKQFEKFGWKSKYRSVVAVVGSVGSSDGINSEGLVANLLYQSDCHFPEGDELIGRSGLSVLLWGQYDFEKVHNLPFTSSK